jgi:ABC-2 type transport system permease protein
VELGFKKYAALLITIAKTSLIADLEYRINFSLRIFTDVIWYFMQLISFEVLFNYTPRIGGWDRHQMRIFMGLLFLADSIYMIFFQENVDRFADKVRKGELDLILTKPVNSQFLVSFQKIAVASFGNFLLSVIFLAWTLYQMPDFTWLRVLWLILVLPTSVIAIYTSRFIFCCLNLVFVKADSVQFLWYNFYRLGMRPDAIYFPAMKLILITILPMSLIASVPARILFDPPNYGLILWTLIMGPILIWVSNKFWRYSLKFYSSASS